MLWVDVLNRALSWRHAEALAGEPHASNAAREVRPHAISRIRSDVTLLRRVFASAYLDTALASEHTAYLSQWLAAVTLAIAPAGAARRAPALRARRHRNASPEPYETWLSTALVQLVGRIEEGAALTAVHRCHGVLRRTRAASGAAVLEVEPSPADWPDDLARPFARRTETPELLAGPHFQQCAKLVVSERGSRYCSKACSNATFAARKAQIDPQYFAEKQQRYRRRKETSPGNRTQSRGAFVYMD